MSRSGDVSRVYTDSLAALQPYGSRQSGRSKSTSAFRPIDGGNYERNTAVLHSTHERTSLGKANMIGNR
jgi:hypothetical protein